jgi:EAL domain-containing protein (putative c-di-GMP-specific phosphodiesterase class I)/PAS domain-containing protein
VGRRFNFRSVVFYAGIAAALVGVAFLAVAMRGDTHGLPWVAFVAGVLTTTALLRLVRPWWAGWIVARRDATVLSLQQRLDDELRLHHKSAQRLVMSAPQLHLVEELLPSMAAYVDVDGVIRFHNRPFRDWLRLRVEHIEGRPLGEVLGAKLYQHVAADAAKAQAGHAFAVEQQWAAPDGSLQAFELRYLPYQAVDGKLQGFFLLQTPVNGSRVVDGSTLAAKDSPILSGVVTTSTEQDMYVESLSEELSSGGEASARIVAAIEHDEFLLYCQRIVALDNAGQGVAHHEVLIRLVEEEQGMMPPGAFFPLVEKYGLMPHLDRWVVKNIIGWLAARPRQAQSNGTRFFVNLALATMSDRTFPGYVREQLNASGVAPAQLCFEITESGLMQRHDDAIRFVNEIRDAGCQVAISGFGRERVSFESLRGIKADYLKIDGSIIFNVMTQATEMAKVTAIARVAKTIGVHTVAELVESEACVAKLRGLGIDFAQGFGVAVPTPLSNFS